jgi:hypothetical protein
VFYGQAIKYTGARGTELPPPFLTCCLYILESRSARGVQHYVIKFVSDLRQLGGFLRVLRFTPPIKLTAAI